MRKPEANWIEKTEFETIASEATARMIGVTGKTCHIKNCRRQKNE